METKAKSDLMSELKRRVLLCDGAMGTQLMARGMPAGACGELWNVEHADAVGAIHDAYVSAGCDLVTTNTFGGTTASLSRHAMEGRARELNLCGAAVARRAAKNRAFVLGDVGPFGGFLEPVGETTAQQARDLFAAQIVALVEGGADAILAETMSDPAEMVEAIKASLAVTDRPVIATYAFGPPVGDYRTMMGCSVGDAVRAAIDAGASVVGSNCGTNLTLEDYLRLADAMVKAAGTTPVILQPNAGFPESRGDGQLIYPATPADMAALMPRLVATGLRIIGGCCGTTPAHLGAMRAALA